MHRVFLPLAVAALLAASPAQARQPTADEAATIEAALAATRAELKDPESARFRNLRAFMQGNGLMAVCGEVNAKNSYGGYIGFQPFTATIKGAVLPDGPRDIGGRAAIQVSCEPGHGGSYPADGADLIVYEPKPQA